MNKIFLLILIFLFSCSKNIQTQDNSLKTEEKSTENNLIQKCTNDSECESKICNRIYKNQGECASLVCNLGEKTDNNNYYCSENKKWEKSKQIGDKCENTYECFQKTCFMNPMCNTEEKFQSFCEKNICVEKKNQDECELKGMIRVLNKNEYFIDQNNNCQESLAQKILETVCVSCGNGICETEESVCNCPKDCKK